MRTQKIIAIVCLLCFITIYGFQRNLIDDGGFRIVVFLQLFKLIMPVSIFIGRDRQFLNDFHIGL